MNDPRPARPFRRKPTARATSSRPKASPPRADGSLRLNRFLAGAGLGSRRACDAIISEGRVTFNGEPCVNLGTVVGPEDRVLVDGKPVRAHAPVYVLLNKPVGYLSTRTDPEQRDTVFDLLPPEMPRLFHVGRLDQDSEGLLILTNDGDLALRLTHPRYKIDKEYEVTLDRTYNTADTPRLLEGMYIKVDGEGGRPPTRARARAESVYRLGPQSIKIILRQGMKRQIRLMLAELGYQVRRLRRTRLGPLPLGSLPIGHWRYLLPRELGSLRER